MTDINERGPFLNLAGLFEGGLALLALGIGWALDVNPLTTLAWDWWAAAWGAAGAVPIFALFLLTYRFPVAGLRRIKEFLVETLGPPLVACRWFDLVLLALLAGFAEEILFRGLIQSWMERWGTATALVASNVLFGLAHCITLTYAVAAGAIGLYLGWLFGTGEDRNLLAPILAHALYDLAAFFVVARTYRNRHDGKGTDEPAAHANTPE